MTKARVVIRNALTFGLNRLSPGEQEDADLFGRCLDALNSIVDEMNGGKGMLWREVLTTSAAISGASAQLGVAWPTLASGDQILGATVQYMAGADLPLGSITMEQYQSIPVKATASLPNVYAHDGAATVYFYPACAGQTITLRTKQAASNFADLDTEYVMPAGFQSAFEDLLAERMAQTLIGDVTRTVSRNAGRARRRLKAQAISPAILGGGLGFRNVLTGWN